MAEKTASTVEEPAAAGDTVTEPAFAEPGAGEPGVSYLHRILAEYGKYRSTRLLTWNNVAAFAPGAPVPQSHPGVPVWLADGSIENVEA
jgi:hypothetical protein